MKISLEIKRKHIIVSLIIIVIIVIGCGFFYLNPRESGQDTTINQNISPELKELPNRLYLFLSLDDSFIMPEGYKFDSQVLDQKILIYPNSQNNVNFKGVEFLEDFQGILLSYGELIKSEEVFRTSCERMLLAYQEKNPDSDATGQFVPDSQGKEKFVITQTSPYKMVDTLLSRNFIIDIVSYEETDAYNEIVDSYSSESPVPKDDLSAVLELQQALVKAYKEQDPQAVFNLLSPESQEKNSVEKLKQGTDLNLFKDKINNEYPVFYIRDGNYILQSKVHFDDNYMRRLDLSFKVDFDGEKNNWSIDAYTVGNKEKFLPLNPDQESGSGEIRLK